MLCNMTCYVLKYNPLLGEVVMCSGLKVLLLRAKLYFATLAADHAKAFREGKSLADAVRNGQHLPVKSFLFLGGVYNQSHMIVPKACD